MIRTIYEDEELIVCYKPVLYDSELSESKNMVTELKEQCKSEIYTIHRLDKIVSGLMVYAKTKESASELSNQMRNNIFKKEYLAVASGVFEEKQGRLEDYIFRDSKNNKTFVVKSKRKGVKKAILNYKILAEGEFKNNVVSLLHVELETGRTHQIRIQFASRKHPLVGDGKYGSKINSDIALWSYGLSFFHPKTKEILRFNLIPVDEIINCFKYDFNYGEIND